MRKTILSCLMAICAIGISSADDFNFECGKSVEVTITPQTGYHFVNWSDGNTENPRIIFMDQDSTLTANIAINTYTVVFKNWNDTALQSETLNHGEAIEYKGTYPTKPYGSILLQIYGLESQYPQSCSGYSELGIRGSIRSNG